MVCDNLFDIWHAAVADFGSVSIEYFVEWIGFGEMFVYYFHKLLPNVCFYMIAIGRVVPGYFSFSSISIYNLLVLVVF